ncbi:MULTISPECIES: NAD-dependent epimerase/dehydratase family protein [unclassified Prochlorococcus]|uniref:NAD-dependent epimerase/dehydratase family protein n=1 Tax=unclassified Prochlorococcus TaxID=2627481 RepID=UPI0005337FE4|nr:MULTISPECIES: NAD-dependent epimerase/dehydratase family protein [unclassified Prochlorococcus]KGG15405.1 Nucleoside-diphosphate-sugar epimerase [Prochlorococcus sp. MIT 0602]KGG17683.1 Nucleoside-diphosphate-sugar epimerase [Prochlorococcus sp. MIT 0603]
MKETKILITGASGCVGQYVCNWLLKNTQAELLLWLRDPTKLSAINPKDSRIKLLIGDLRNPEIFSTYLAQATHVVHTATAWGDVKRANEVNLIAVNKLISYLNPDVLQKFIYFSTASILNKKLEPLNEASKFGTEYIQTKARCLEQLEENYLSNKIIAVFPTLVFGGKFDSSGIFPASYLTQGLKEAVNWLWLAKWFKAYSRFHFIHAEDIAFICGQLLKDESLHSSNENGKSIKKFVLGQPYLSIDQAIYTLLKWRGQKRVFSFPLWAWLIELLVGVLPLKITSWDRFSIKQRHFIHEPVTSPEDFGGKSFAKSLDEILMHSGLPKEKNRF